MVFYRDECKCPKCGIKIIIDRREASIGKTVQTWCWNCKAYHKIKAGEPKNK